MATSTLSTQAVNLPDGTAYNSTTYAPMTVRTTAGTPSRPLAVYSDIPILGRQSFAVGSVSADGTGVSDYGRILVSGSPTTYSYRIVFQVPTVPNTASDFAVFQNVAASTSIHTFGLNGANAIQFKDAGASITGPVLTAGTKYMIRGSTTVGTTTSNGTATATLYASDGTTVLYTGWQNLTARNFGTSGLALLRLGKLTGGTAYYTFAFNHVRIDTATLTDVGNVDRTFTASAGPDQSVETGTTATLDSSGTVTATGVATRTWTQTAGPTVTLSSTTAAQPTFTVGAVGTTYTFQVAVTDYNEPSVQNSTDTVTVTSVAPFVMDRRGQNFEGVPAGAALTLANTASGGYPVITYRSNANSDTVGTTTGVGQGSTAALSTAQTGVITTARMDAFGVKAEGFATLIWLEPSATYSIIGVRNSTTRIVTISQTAGAVKLSSNSSDRYTTPNAVTVRGMYWIDVMYDVGTTTSDGKMKFAVRDASGAFALGMTDYVEYTGQNTGGGTMPLELRSGAAGTEASTRVVQIERMETVNAYASAMPSVSNQSPSISVSNQSVAVGGTVTMTATVTDPDGSIVSTACTQTAGPTVTLSGSGATRTFTPTAGGVYTFNWVTTDDAGATSSVNNTVRVRSNFAVPYSVQANPGAWTIVGGAADRVVALTDGSDTTGVETGDAPSGSSITYALTPLNAGVVNLTYRDKANNGTNTISRTISILDSDVSTVLGTATYTLATTITARTLSTTASVAQDRQLYLRVTDTQV